METKCLTLPFILASLILLSFSCQSKKEQTDETTTFKDEEETYAISDTIDMNSIHIFAEVLYDSTSYIVLENHSPLPVTYDSNYRFEQNTYGRWKNVKIRQKDTTRIVLYPQDKDTLRMNISDDIGYSPIGACRIYKTIRTINNTQQFECMTEANARPQQIDWNKVELIPDNTIPDTTFVTMTVKTQNRNILITLHNHTDREITLGDNTSYSLAVFQNGQWYAITYPQLEHSIAIILPPNGEIKEMVHTLPNVNYDFKAGRYRITKSFFFESDYKNKYIAGAEFML